LAGNPTAAGPYTIALQVPANTGIAAHTHRDDRVASVVSGTWYFGYGAKAEEGVKALGPGSFYTEPAGATHFARTGAKPVILYVHGFGPTDTQYLDRAADPRR
jgi:quercetin dioxygenase-like cupin family protein